MKDLDFYFTAAEYFKIKQMVEQIPGSDSINQDDKIHLFYNLVFLDAISRRVKLQINRQSSSTNDQIRPKKVWLRRNPWFD